MQPDTHAQEEYLCNLSSVNSNYQCSTIQLKHALACAGLSPFSQPLLDESLSVVISIPTPLNLRPPLLLFWLISGSFPSCLLTPVIPSGLPLPPISGTLSSTPSPHPTMILIFLPTQYYYRPLRTSITPTKGFPPF
jgi:hypothetical protein